MKNIKWYAEHKNLYKEWDFDKNEKNIGEYQIKEKVWWQCQYGHMWEARIGNRIYLKRGCPRCAGKFPSHDNNLMVMFPEVAKKWNYKKNKDIPENILPRSTKKVWWKCKNEHEWTATLHSMTNKKTKIGCPYCKGILPSANNNILNLKHIMSEWDYDKNTIDPCTLTKSKSTKIHWKCGYGHEWIASVASRTRGTRCPFCRRKLSDMEIRVYSEIKSLFDDAVWHYNDKRMEIDVFVPSLRIGLEIDGSFWHKNRDNKDNKKNKYFNEKQIQIIRLREHPLEKIGAHDVIYKNQENYFNILKQICKILYSITKNKKFSNYLKLNNFINEDLYLKYRHSVLAGRISIAEKRPNLIKEWNFKKNKTITPHNISYGSGRKVWWKCTKGHEWCACIKNRNDGCGCPYCCNKLPMPENNLLYWYPEVKDLWDYEKNDKLPEEFLSKSHTSVWWKDKKDGISKEIPISSKVRYIKNIVNCRMNRQS